MRKIIPFILFTCLLSACSSIDCPLENTIYTVYGLYKSTGKIDTLKDTLTISTTRMNGTDSILINKDVKVTSLSVPMSYTQDTDILYFETRKNSSRTIDTVKVEKTNIPHFESVDCSASYFHKITNVSCTHHAIDSIVINNPNVTYDKTKQTFHLYLKNNN